MLVPCPALEHLRREFCGEPFIRHMRGQASLPLQEQAQLPVHSTVETHSLSSASPYVPRAQAYSPHHWLLALCLK